MKKIVVFYHADCPDGFGGAWAAWRKFGTKAQYIPRTHSDLPPKELKNKTIYLIDIAYSEKHMKRVVRDNTRIIVIDHHLTTKHILPLAHEHVYHAKHSGAVLAWNYFFPKQPIPTLLKYIEDRDFYRFSRRHAKELLAALDNRKKDFKTWSRFVKKAETKPGFARFVAEGTIITEFEKRLVSHIARKATMVKFEGIETLAANTPILQSDVAHALYRAHPPIAIVWSFKGKNLNVSLRSGGKNVRVLAEKYGGGGHNRAAGFTIRNAKRFPWRFIPITQHARSII